MIMVSIIDVDNGLGDVGICQLPWSWLWSPGSGL